MGKEDYALEGHFTEKQEGEMSEKRKEIVKFGATESPNHGITALL